MTDPNRNAAPPGDLDGELDTDDQIVPAQGGCRRAGCGFVLGVLGSAVITLGVLAILLTRGHPISFASGLLARGAADTATPAGGTAVAAALPSPTATPRPSATARPTPTFIFVPTAVPTSTPSPTPTPTPTPMIRLQQVNSLGRYETTQYVIQTVVDLSRQPSNFWERICGSDQLLLVAGGEVIAGFDLSKVGPNDLRVSGKSLKLVLPPPEVFSYFVKEDQTYVYQRNTGLLCRPSPNLETDARRQAEQRLLEYALGQGILQKAEQNGLNQLQAFFRDLGFEQVELTVSE